MQHWKRERPDLAEMVPGRTSTKGLRHTYVSVSELFGFINGTRIEC